MNLTELLGEELATQVEAKLGDKKIAVVNDGSWLPKVKFDEKLEEIKGLKAEISGRDEQLGKLKGAASGNEDLMKRITDLQAANQENELKYAQELRDTRLATAIKLALNGKVQDLDIVGGLIDKKAIELDEAGNVVKGLDEQVATLKESKSFLFLPEQIAQVQEEPKPNIKMSTGNPKTGANEEVDVFAAALAKIVK